MKIDTIERPKVEKLTEPARQWQCRFRALIDSRDKFSGGITLAGGLCVFDELFPSKDAAETAAAQFMRRGWHPICLEYIGAFPVTP